MLNNQEIKKPVLIKDLGMMYPTCNSKMRKRHGVYKCYCGKEFKAISSNVNSEITKSCGCYNIKRSKEANTTHGFSDSVLHNTWTDIKQRCNNPKDKSFIHYGERCIKICDEWANDFKSFYDWSVLNGWKKGLSIDRINNDGNYEPNNCRWTNQYVQSRNTRLLKSTNTSGFRGVSYYKINGKYRAGIRVNKKLYHLGYFNLAIEAAKAYDRYVIDNNLEHTINGVLL